MDAAFLLDTPWRYLGGGLLALVGLRMVWRGLIGEPGGERGLIRRTASGLGRVEGWRLFVLGLAVVCLGAAWLVESRALLFLALGFGYCEVQEATGVINAWRWGNQRAADLSTPRRAG